MNILMVFDQIGSSFELAKQIGEIFFFYVFGYFPEFKYSAIYCIMVVCHGCNLVIIISWVELIYCQGQAQVQVSLALSVSLWLPLLGSLLQALSGFYSVTVT